jgi:hypothetical protein
VIGREQAYEQQDSEAFHGQFPLFDKQVMTKSPDKFFTLPTK